MINFIEREERVRFNRVHGITGSCPVYFKGGGGPPTYVAPVYTTLTPGELGAIDFEKINPEKLLPLVFEEIKPEEVVDLKLGKLRPGELKNVVYERLQEKGLTAAQLQKLETLPELKLANLEKLPDLQLRQLADLKQVKLEKLGEQPDLQLDRSAKDDVSTVYGDEFGRQKDVLGTLSATLGEANRLDDEEVLKSLDRTAPGLRDSIRRRMATTEAFQKGQLSSDALSEIFRQAAATGASTGLQGASAAQKSLTMRDLGRSSLDLMREGDSRVLQDRQLAESLRGGNMKVGDQLLSTREILNRRDREYEDNLATTREEQRDKVATERQRNLYNNQLANQEITANTNLENQRLLYNIGLSNEERRANDARAVQRQLVNFDINNQMMRDKAMTDRQVTLANYDMENEMRRQQNQLDNQTKMFDLGLSNQEKEMFAGLRNQETFYNLEAGNRESAYRTDQLNAANRSNLALRNQALLTNTAGLNAAYLSNIDTENRKRSANLGFRQTETLTNLNIKNRQADANAQVANMNAQAQYEYDQRNGGSPFGSLFGGMGGALVGGLVGTLVAPGVGTLMGAGLGLSMGGGIGGASGGAQGRQMAGVLAGAGGMMSNFGGMMMPAAAAPSLLSSFNMGTGGFGMSGVSSVAAASMGGNNMAYNWLGMPTQGLDFSVPQYFR